MNHPLRSILLCGASLLPFSTLQALPYGGLVPQKKFTLTVTKVTSVFQDGSTTQTGVPIPAGMPSFRLGERVKFTIGRNGELTARGVNIAFKNANRMTNNYLDPVTPSHRILEAAGIFKTATGQPQTMALNYRKGELTATAVAISTVGYVLKK